MAKYFQILACLQNDLDWHLWVSGIDTITDFSVSDDVLKVTT